MLKTLRSCTFRASFIAVTLLLPPWGVVGCDASTEVDALRGPAELPVDGDANGLWWDAGEEALYIADDNGNRILKWTDTDGTSLVAALPSPAPEGAGLGQLVRTSDGGFAVTRFGYGTLGDVAFVSPDGVATAVTGLDPERRRIGLTVTEDGTLFDSWFVRLSTGDRVGGVGRLDLDAGTEVQVIDGLQKPAGVLAVGDSLYVTDKDLGQVLRAPLSSPANYEVFAEVEGPDLLCAGPDGSFFMGGADGGLFQVSAGGEVSLFASGFQEVRGVAYDAKNRRVFLADHDPDEADGITHVLRVLPVDP